MKANRKGNTDLPLDIKDGKSVKPLRYKKGEQDLYEKYKYRYRKDEFIWNAF